MEQSDKHQHKQRNNLKELGKWERQGQSANHRGKMQMDMSGPNNPHTGYSLGRKTWKLIKNKKSAVKCLFLAAEGTKVEWGQTGSGLEDGWSLREAT